MDDHPDSNGIGLPLLYIQDKITLKVRLISGNAWDTIMQKHINLGGLITINLSWMGLSFMWNSLHVILLPAVLLNYVNPDQKNSILGLLTGAGLFIAILIQPIAGTFSDGLRSKWGRRRPLIGLGTSADIIFLIIMALAGGIPGLAIGYIGLQFTSNISHGAMQGLIPDCVPDAQLGQASAFKTVMDVLGLVVASIGMGRLVPPSNATMPGPITLVILVLVITTLVTFMTTKETSINQVGASLNPLDALTSLFKIDFKKNSKFGWLIIGRLVFLLGVYGIQAFSQYFIRDTLPTENPVKLTGDLMALIVVGLVLASFLAGYLNDHLGSRFVHWLAAILVALGSISMAFAHTEIAVLISGLIVGSGIGIFLTANWALANTLAPRQEAGKFLGLTNLATAGAGALSRLMGLGIDWGNRLQPGFFYGYSILFLLSAVFAFFGLGILHKAFIPIRNS